MTLTSQQQKIQAAPSSQTDKFGKEEYIEACSKILGELNQNSSNLTVKLAVEYLNHLIRLERGDTAEGRIAARLGQIEERINKMGHGKTFNELINHTGRLAKNLAQAKLPAEEVLLADINPDSSVMPSSLTTPKTFEVEIGKILTRCKELGIGLEKELRVARRSAGSSIESITANIDEAVAVCYEAGFTDPHLLQTIVAIGCGESKLRRDAHNKGENSRGFFQIHMPSHGDKVRRLGISPQDVFDPKWNAVLAYQVFQGRGGFSPWTVYREGIHKQYMGIAGEAVDRFLAAKAA